MLVLAVRAGFAKASGKRGPGLREGETGEGFTEVRPGFTETGEGVTGAGEVGLELGPPLV